MSAATITTATTELAAGPYAAVAHALLRSGYGPLPLPAGRKASPPSRWTGSGAPMPSGADVQAWVDDPATAAGNVGARLPEDVVGIDVDAYAMPGGNVKTGDATMRTLTAELGRLPRTVVSSSRPGSTSGIRLFRLPGRAVGQKLRGAAGTDVDVIQHGHRYLVVAPSMVDGRTYALVDQRHPGRRLEVLPAAVDLPELPAEWVDHLLAAPPATTPTVSPAGTPAAGAPAGSPLTNGLPDDRVVRAQRELVGGLAGGNRHDATTAAVAALVRLGEQGHPGIRAAVADGRERFVAAVGPDRAGGPAEAGAEYDRMVGTAVDKVTADPSLHRADVSWDPPGAELPGAADDGTAVGGPDARERAARAELARLLTRRDAQRMLADLDRQQDQTPAFDAGLLADVLEREPDPPPRVPQLVPAAANVLLVAQRKTGKTTFLLNYAASLLTGDDFLGALPVVPVEGCVAVLNYEVSAGQLARWASEAGVPTDRFLLVNLRGRRDPLSDPQDRAHLAALLREHRTEVLLVDPFGQAFGGDQNSAAEVTPWLRDLGAFTRNEAGATDLVLAVHAGWDGERTRGSSALEDWPDSIIKLTRRKDDEAGPVYLRAMGRDVDLAEDELSFEPTTRRLRLTRNGPRSAGVSSRRLDEVMGLIVAMVTETPDMGVRAIREALRADGGKVGNSTVTKALQVLTERRILFCSAGPDRSQHYALNPINGAPEWGSS